MANQPFDPSKIQDEAVAELVERGGRSYFDLPGDEISMVPTLRPGQRICLEFPAGHLRRGDLVFYRLRLDLAVNGPDADTKSDRTPKKQWVAHRYLDGRTTTATPDSLRTRGDARLPLDEPLAAERVKARVVAVEDAAVWRSLDGGAARVYATALAWHNLWWAWLGRLGGRFEGLLAAIGLRVPLRSLVWFVDRWGLRLTHRCLFRLVHREIDPPLETGPGSPPDVG